MNNQRQQKCQGLELLLDARNVSVQDIIGHLVGKGLAQLLQLVLQLLLHLQYNLLQAHVLLFLLHCPLLCPQIQAATTTKGSSPATLAAKTLLGQLELAKR